MFAILIKRIAVIACVAMAVASFTIAGCQSPDRTAEGPPPAGFDTWEDYWEVQDELKRDTATQIEQRQRERDVVGGPR